MIVQIVGVAPSANLLPPDAQGAQRWCFNVPHMYRVRCPQLGETWTAWFNLHSAKWILQRYPHVYAWYRRQTKPVILQETFPGQELIAVLGSRYFTCSVAWLIALALSGADNTRIELWGFGGDHKYAEQRPCIAYWIQRARALGIEVVTSVDFGEPGDGANYTGLLYGYETT